MNEGLGNNPDKKPEHIERAEGMFAGFVNRIMNKQSQDQKGQENTYNFPDDPKDFDAAKEIGDYKATQTEQVAGPLKEVPQTEHSLPPTEQDIQDSTQLLNTPMTGDQLIHAIDEAKKPPTES